MHHIILNTESYFGPGCVSMVGAEAVERDFKRAFIVTDETLVRFGTLRPVLASLQASGVDHVIFDKVLSNPSIAAVQAGVAAFQKSDCDFIVAAGGGSPIDLAKAVSVIAANPEHIDVRSLEHTKQTRNRGVCLFAIPTTAGTASEVTVDYVITDEEHARKFLVADDNCIPRVAFIDAQMMAGMPQSLAAATGMDALTHAIEAYLSRRAWTMTDIFALQAIECIAKHLKHSCHREEARENMALGQYLAGMAFSNCGLGATHALAHPLSSVHNIPHGVANAIMLPHVMAFNAQMTGERYRDIAKAMGVRGTENMRPEQYREAAIGAVRALANLVSIPKGLAELGVTRESIPQMAALAVADATAPDNPRPLHTGNAEELYAKAF